MKTFGKPAKEAYEELAPDSEPKAGLEIDIEDDGDGDDDGAEREASKDLLAAMKANDPEAARLALKSFVESCMSTYGKGSKAK